MKKRLLTVTFGLAACATPIDIDHTKDRDEFPSATILKYQSLKGWRSHDPAPAIPAFLRSCAAYSSRTFNTMDFLPAHAGLGDVSKTQLDEICHQAERLTARSPDPAIARQFFEAHFTPVQLGQKEALFTGYFEPSYRATRTAVPGYVPLLSRPSDLVSVDLGQFSEELRGKRIAGRVESGRLLPYKSHEEIISSPPETETLAWLDPNDLLFLQIQGSGRLVYDSGETMRVGYAGQNGHNYIAIGRTLVRNGDLPLEEISMQSIRAWLERASPESAAQVRYSNPSYVFFRELDDLTYPDLGPLGAQGVQLTPHRSIAVDDAYYRYGLPVWVELDDQGPSHSLYIAQDTGGAITGAQRGDLFFGSGDDAAFDAGRLKAPGRMIVFLPRDNDDAP